jgi:ATP/maltotriose-dependent transcriptional regulator MalT
MQQAGVPQAALTLLASAAAGPLDERDRALAQRLRGQIALYRNRGGEAAPLLLDAARRLEALDAGLARATLLETMWAASLAGRLGGGMLEAAEAARRAPPAPEPRSGADLLLDGLAVRFTQGYGASAPILKRALSAFRRENPRPGQDMRWPWLACRVAADLYDDETWHVLATRYAQIARGIGALGALPPALNYLVALRVFEGDLDAGAALMEEADAITAVTGNARMVPGRLMLAGYRGDEALALAVIEDGAREAGARGEGVVLTFDEYARAVLYNGLGRYDAALAGAQQATVQDDLSVSAWAFPELVEAAARCGQSELAVAALERLAERTGAAGTQWAMGIEARSRAVVSEDGRAEDHYREAIDRLGRCRVAMELARARLLYGEWLRRVRRRRDAREQLRSAHEMFSAMGARAFADRAGRELLATGETVRKRTGATPPELTPHEARIARMARDGASNQEIGSQLFISHRTVEYHLHKVFTKLGISSRDHLDRVLQAD